MFQNDINNGETTSRLQLASAVDTGILGLLKALGASIEVFVEVTLHSEKSDHQNFHPFVAFCNDDQAKFSWFEVERLRV